MERKWKEILFIQGDNHFVNMFPILLSGFLLGFAGSLHCVGMCGPLSLALPVYRLPAPLKLFALFTYQLGRVITYSLLGLLFGLAGRGIYLVGVQQWFSITLGIFMLMLAVFYFMKNRMMHVSFLNRFYAAVSKLIGKILRQYTGPAGFLLLGMANGLLPCGMVYIALTASLAFYKVYQSVGFLAMFGAGTMPAMMLVAYGAQLASPRLKIIFRKSVPFFITAAGLVLIIRGMNLGIPYLSPQVHAVPGQVIICH